MISGFTNKVVYVILLGGLWLLSACAAAAPEDIPVTPATEAQSAPLGTPIMEIQSDSAPLPTASLPTEITEPISPISPIAPPPVEPAPPAQEALVIPNAQAVPLLPDSETAFVAAIADLAKQIGVSPDQITLVSMEAQEWSDAALGCPQEGMMYAQVITPGFLMILSAQGQQYEYHTDQKTSVIWCKK